MIPELKVVCKINLTHTEEPVLTSLYTLYGCIRLGLQESCIAIKDGPQKNETSANFALSFQDLFTRSGLTLAGRQKIAQVYKQNFTGRLTLQPLRLKVQLRSKSLETIRKLTLAGRLTLPGMFTREKVNLHASVTLLQR